MNLSIRTDSDNAQLVLREATATVMETDHWPSGRKLADQLLGRIDSLLCRHHLHFSDLAGIIVYEGPGSFTSLRIGVSSANALAYGLDIPVVGATGDDWLGQGWRALAGQTSPQIITPLYGAEPNITKPQR